MPGLIVHSDRGSQYASDLYQALLGKHSFVCSMSRKGNCWDNAVAERFFLNLKMERVWQREYANQAEAKIDVTAYIVRFYNCERLNSVLGNLPPSVFERNMAAKNLWLCPKLVDHYTPQVVNFPPSEVSGIIRPQQLAKTVALASTLIPAFFPRAEKGWEQKPAIGCMWIQPINRISCFASNSPLFDHESLLQARAYR